MINFSDIIVTMPDESCWLFAVKIIFMEDVQCRYCG